MEDILVYSRDAKEHDSHLRLVLKTLNDYRLFTRLNKCEFWLNEVRFLGQVISKEGVRADLGKIEVIVGW